MVKQSLIIDITSEQIAGCLLGAGDSFKPKFLNLKMPPRAVVVMESGKLNILVGEAAEIYQSDEETLVFDNLLIDLPELEDDYVQVELSKAFWSAICFTASKRYEINFDSETTGFIIYPQSYSSRLLEAFRTGCSHSENIKHIAFVSEAAALVFGLIQNDLSEFPASRPAAVNSLTFAAILGYTEKHFEVVCFDYKIDNEQISQLSIRDYFRTTAKNLTERVRTCEWKTTADATLFLEPENFKNLAKARFANDLQTIIPKLRFEQDYTQALDSLKSLGASKIAKYGMANAENMPEFELVNTTNIGIRVDQQSFYPVLQKAVFNAETKYPCFSAKTFDFSAMAENEFVFSIHAGYSELIKESVVLGYLPVNAADLSCLKGANKSELVAVACLNTPGEGEFTLGLMPDNRIIGKLSFVLPGMVC